MNALLTRKNADSLRLACDGVVYEPVPSDAALGGLLFCLQPEDVVFDGAPHDDRTELGQVLATARQFARILQRHAARTDRSRPDLPGAATVEAARAWAASAAGTVPADELERFCWRLARRLGPDPWCDGSPAIQLRHQQFGLFEWNFDDDAPAPSDATVAQEPGS